MADLLQNLAYNEEECEPWNNIRFCMFESVSIVLLRMQKILNRSWISTSRGGRDLQWLSKDLQYRRIVKQGFEDPVLASELSRHLSFFFFFLVKVAIKSHSLISEKKKKNPFIRIHLREKALPLDSLSTKSELEKLMCLTSNCNN